MPTNVDDQLRTFYARLSRAEWGEERIGKSHLPGIIRDYTLHLQVEEDLRPLGRDAERDAAVQEFRKIVDGRRTAFQREEIAKLHRQWGGKVLLAPESGIEAYLSAMAQGQQIVAGGQVMVTSAYYGSIAPETMNQGLTGFSGGSGQIRLLSALAVVTGRFDWNIQRLPPSVATLGIDVKALQWKRVPIDWRRGAVILADPNAFQSGIDGYKRFATAYADGDMHKAYSLASALLSTQDFEAIAWGKQILLKMKDVERVQNALRMGDETGPFTGIDGYKRFATAYADGDMHKAYILASALLSTKDFGALAWGKAILLKVKEYEFIKNYLESELARRTISGMEGWKNTQSRFPEIPPLALWKSASALLNERFLELDWPTSPEVKASTPRQRRRVPRNRSTERGAWVFAPGALPEGHVETTLQDMRSEWHRGVHIAARGAVHTAVGAIPFAVGSYGSHLLLKPILSQEGSAPPSAGEVLQTYAVMATGGGASRTLINGLGNRLNGQPFFSAKPYLAHSFPAQTVPTLVAIGAMDVMENGEFYPEHYPQAMANIMAATTTTHTLSHFASRSVSTMKWLHLLRLAQGASLVAAPETGGLTLLGTCLMELVHFTMISLLGYGESVAIQDINDSAIQKKYEKTAIRACGASPDCTMEMAMDLPRTLTPPPPWKHKLSFLNPLFDSMEIPADIILRDRETATVISSWATLFLTDSEKPSRLLSH